jgi:biotin operon repressor
MSQCDDILAHLKRGPISAIEALNNYGCFRLAARIKDLRAQGYDIETKKLDLPNGKTVAQYHLKESETA